MIMCVHPIPIKDVNTGKVNLVPCGKCLECRQSFQNEWIFRLSQEIKYHSTLPCFVTLTYDDEHLPLGDNGDYTQSVLLKSDVQLFLKRLRKNGGALMKGLKYFAIGEYGAKFNRAHYHLVLMAPNLLFVSQMQRLVDKSWRDRFGEPIGFTKTKLCTDKQIHYVCKYMNKIDDRKHLVKPFRLFSRGLGLGYLSMDMIKYYLTTLDRTCPNGIYRIPLPRYFRKKLDEFAMTEFGKTYCELLPEVIPERGSNYEWFREFQNRLQKMSDLSDEMFAQHGFTLALPSMRKLFDAYFSSVDICIKTEYESARRLEMAKIRNKLNKSDTSNYSHNVDWTILMESFVNSE